jgi:hypothetical protein
MKRKQAKRTRIIELTPEIVGSMDQETLVSLVMKLYEQNKQLSEHLQAFIQEKYGPKTERHEDPNQLKLLPEAEAQPSQQSESPAKDPPIKKPGHSRNPMP